MLAVRTPIAGIFIAVLVLVGEVVGMNAYVAARTHHHRHAHIGHVQRATPAPTFGHHHRCMDDFRISGPDDEVSVTR